MIDRHFVYLCPIRDVYSICFVDTQGRHYTAPSWAIDGTMLLRDGDGCWGQYQLQGDSTTHLYNQVMDLVIDDPETVQVSPYVWSDKPTQPLDGLVALVAHYPYEMEGGPTMTDQQYEAWTRGVDILFGQPGAHTRSVKAAKARHKKKAAARARTKRREAIRRGELVE